MKRDERDENRQDWLADQVRENGRFYFRLAHGVLRDRTAAEDVCQQAFLKAWEHRASVRDAAAGRAWLARIVVNQSLQLVRRRKSEKRAMLTREARTPAGDTRVQLELRDAVVEAMGELPEMQRLVVALRIMEGMRGTEVAPLLGCSEAEVSRQLHAGMTRLRDLMGSWRDDAFRLPA